MSDQGGQGGLSDGTPSLVPIPDPTVLTTAAIRRDIDHLRELFDVQLDDLKGDLERFQTGHLEKHRDVVDKAIGHLRELCEEQFRGIQKQFDERDTRASLNDQAAKEAIAAALAAAKEAVTAAMAAAEKSADKMELAFTKQFDAIGKQLETIVGGMNAQFSDLKERISKAEAAAMAATEKTAGKSAGLSQAGGIVVAALGILIGLSGVALAIVTAR